MISSLIVLGILIIIVMMMFGWIWVCISMLYVIFVSSLIVLLISIVLVSCYDCGRGIMVYDFIVVIVDWCGIFLVWYLDC